MLRHKMRRINDPGFQRVAQFVRQSPADHFKCAALIMAFEVLDVLQQKGLRPVMHQDPQHVKKQRTLRFVKKPMQPPERILF